MICTQVKEPNEHSKNLDNKPQSNSQPPSAISSYFNKKLQELCSYNKFSDLPVLMDHQGDQNQLIEELQKLQQRGKELQQKLEHTKQTRKNIRQYFKNYTRLYQRTQSPLMDQIIDMKKKHQKQIIKHQSYNHHLSKTKNRLLSFTHEICVQMCCLHRLRELFYRQNKNKGEFNKLTEIMNEAFSEYQRLACFKPDYQILEHHQDCFRGYQSDPLVNSVFQGKRHIGYQSDQEEEDVESLNTEELIKMGSQNINNQLKCPDQIKGSKQPEKSEKPEKRGQQQVQNPDCDQDLEESEDSDCQWPRLNISDSDGQLLFAEFIQEQSGEDEVFNDEEGGEGQLKKISESFSQNGQN